MVFGNSLIKNKSVNYEDMLPQNYEVIKSFKMISEDFGNSNSGMIVLTIDDSFKNSNEIKSVCDPELVKYSKKIEDSLKNTPEINSVKGIGNSIYSVYNMIPNDLSKVKQVCKSSLNSQIISKDESMALITLSFNEDVSSKDATEIINNVIINFEKPSGIKVDLAGDIFAQQAVLNEIGPSIAKTSSFSMILIVLILFLMFKKVKYVFTPLTTIIFGVIWTTGFLGLMNMGLSTMTSGTISMIMGIGIDFGIQIISRFNYEKKSNKKTKAMENTLNGVISPILITTISCLIGFKAMGLGELSMMKEIGDILSYGILFCMLASLTIVPSILLLLTRDNENKDSLTRLKNFLKKDYNKKINKK
jgi:predicted RND superfamily exporter protein